MGTDLDSMVCALLYGLLKANLQPQSKSYASPILNIPREDLILRPELSFVLAKAGIPEELVPCLDEVRLEGMEQVVLVDHNVPAHAQSFLADSVVGIVDHHEDEGQFPNADPRMVRVAGSCTSLILQAWAREAEKQPRLLRAFGPECLHLALASMLQDTVGFKTQYGKVQPVDLDSLAWEGSELEGYMDALTRVRSDVSGLASRDLLRKDYKEWVVVMGKGEGEDGDSKCRLGISSVPYARDRWIERDGVDEVEKAVEAWVAERSLDLHLILTAYTGQGDKGFSRELSLYITTTASSSSSSSKVERRGIGGQDFAERLEAQTRKSLDLHPISTDRALRWWVQGNVQASRKQVYPLVRDLISCHAQL
ncbi:MAG: hypothetical protein DHS80DRAFT_15789 [Piptocephalis tieghemiana]|nr:MAG: hypothetical protein DHS80DRAFT_15789 [Piptocephalis tieghemiana]